MNGGAAIGFDLQRSTRPSFNRLDWLLSSRMTDRSTPWTISLANSLQWLHFQDTIHTLLDHYHLLYCLRWSFRQIKSTFWTNSVKTWPNILRSFWCNDLGKGRVGFHPTTLPSTDWICRRARTPWERQICEKSEGEAVCWHVNESITMFRAHLLSIKA